MFGEPPRKVFEVVEVQDSFENWANRPYIADELRPQLAKSNLLILPTEQFREIDYPVFPKGTEDLFVFLKENSPSTVHPEICINDEDYKELALHSALLIAGGFLLTSIIVPVVVNLISEYLKAKATSKDDRVNIQLTVIENNGRAFKIKYEGPIPEFEQKVLPIITKLNTNTEINSGNIHDITPE
jgi:hypothetical protein